MIRAHRLNCFKGFTLIELLAVIAIIGILATFAAISISGAVKRARDSVRQRDLTNLKQALELYNQDQGSYPPGSGDAAQILNSVLKDYIKTVPTDPKYQALQNQQDYYYAASNQGDNYVVWAQMEYSKGAATNLPGISDCGSGQQGAKNPDIRGNGLVRTGTGSAGSACFRLSND